MTWSTRELYNFSTRRGKIPLDNKAIGFELTNKLINGVLSNFTIVIYIYIYVLQNSSVNMIFQLILITRGVQKIGKPKSLSKTNRTESNFSVLVWYNSV